MSQGVRATYEDGRLRVLDPVDLTEEEQVQLTIFTEQERTRAALGDLLVVCEPARDDSIDEAELQAEIDATMQGQVPVSDAITQERQAGP